MSNKKQIDSAVFSKFTVAIRYFKLDVVKEMIAQDPELLDTNYLGHSPISAALNGSVREATPIFVKLFLEESGASPEVIKRMMHNSASGTHVLREALQHKHEDVALMILKHDPDIDLHQTSRNYSTPMLMIALANGLAVAAKEMIRRGARVTDICTEYSNRNALHWAAQGTPATIDLVYPTLKNNIDLPDTEGQTPFIHAVNADKVEATLHLAVLGANIHLADEDGANALMRCAKNQKEPKLLRHLLDLGLDKLATDKDGCCAMHYIGIQPWLRPKNPATLDMINILVEANIPIDVRDNTGRTPLMVAAKNYEESDYKVNGVLPFLRAGANPTLQDNNGKTAADYTDDERMKKIIVWAQKRWVARQKREQAKRLKDIDALCHSGVNDKTPVMRKIALKPRRG